MSRTAALPGRLPPANSAHLIIPGDLHTVTAADTAIVREPPLGAGGHDEGAVPKMSKVMADLRQARPSVMWVFKFLRA